MKGVKTLAKEREVRDMKLSEMSSFDLIKKLWEEGKLDRDFVKSLVLKPEIGAQVRLTKEEYELITGEEYEL